MRRATEFLLWAGEIFGPVAFDRRERVTRFLEEALEVAQADGVPASLVEKLTERIWLKDSTAANTPREIGQAYACLEMYAQSAGVDPDEEATREFDRVRSIPKVVWMRRHQLKVAAGIADVPPSPAAVGLGGMRSNVPENELLPCPFCGGCASYDRVGTARQSCIISCDSCGCTLETGEVWSCGQRWNERHPSPSRRQGA